MEEKLKVINYLIPESLRDALKKLAVDKKITMRDAVVEAITEYLIKHADERGE